MVEIDGPSLWVAVLDISEKVARKIDGRHAFDVDDVHRAIVCQSNLEYVWDADDLGRTRAVIRVRIGRRWARVVVYPAVGAPMGDVYNLATAYDV